MLPFRRKQLFPLMHCHTSSALLLAIAAKLAQLMSCESHDIRAQPSKKRGGAIDAAANAEPSGPIWGRREACTRYSKKHERRVTTAQIILLTPPPAAPAPPRRPPPPRPPA